jgi:hypothetical protein
VDCVGVQINFSFDRVELYKNMTFDTVLKTLMESRMHTYGILSSKLFRPTVRKNCSSSQETLLKLEAEDREFAKILRSLEQFI